MASSFPPYFYSATTLCSPSSIRLSKVKSHRSYSNFSLSLILPFFNTIFFEKKCYPLILPFFNTIFFENICYHTIIFEKFVITLKCDFEVNNRVIALDLDAITYVIHPV